MIIIRPTRAYIDLRKLEKNINTLKTFAKDAEYMAVVKANAYGHGAVEIGSFAISAGADWLAVAIPSEGAQLRESGIDAPILVLGPIAEDEAKLVVKYDLVQTVFSKDMARLLNEIGRKHKKIIPIHIKLDTGMGRIGIRSDKELIDFIKIVQDLPYINCQGIFTHFATSDEDDKSFMQRQLQIFKSMLTICRKYNMNFKYIHTANSAAILQYPDAYFNLVRGGIAMYGYNPTSQIAKDRISLSPILQWHSKIVHIKEVEAGTPISYGKTFIAPQKMKIATLPVGYADGYNRLLSNRGHVLVDGKMAPILGRICMDQTMIDITHIPRAHIGKDVILLGSQGQTSISADDIAKLCNTISYEVLANISDRVERIYIGH